MSKFEFELREQLNRIENLLLSVVGTPKGKEWYSTAEVAKILGKRPFTVRQWCREGRINAHKRDCGRGNEGEWEISADEIERYRNHGLLEAPGYRNLR